MTSVSFVDFFFHPCGLLARPGSERVLGELLDFDFQALSLMQMASDALMRHRQAIEAHLFLFDLSRPSMAPAVGGRRNAALTLGLVPRLCAPLAGLCREGG